MKTISDVIDLVKTYDEGCDCELIQKAYEYAERSHDGVLRKSGEPYIIHPIEVAYILAELECDSETIAASLLHDVIEDTEHVYDDIAEEFGETVADLVDGVTKITKLNYTSAERQQVETYRKMFVAMAKDIRVILIKLADRLHNMRTLDAMSPAKQKIKSRETLDIYAPIAHRLGIYTIKMELEDLSLKYLEPEKYRELIEKVAQSRSERQEFIQKLIDTLADKLDDENISYDIYGRPKHFYSIYKKMEGGKSFEEIYDLFAIRVLVESVNDCYAVLGWVHTLWKPMPNRIKDYIAMPKSNKYQSLHTTVIGPGNKPFEIQIRTYEMHRVAEYGIAAHTLYKEGTKGADELGEWLRWLQDIKDMESEDLEEIKHDLAMDEIFVYTPKGKVIELPKDSTPIDFAYRIHSDIGNKCIGAKVNGKIVPLNHKLKTTDFVEIITKADSKGPNRDWLNFAVSNHARAKIRAFFRKAAKEENVAKGKAMMERELKNHKLTLNDIMKPEYLDFISDRFNATGWDDLFSSIGYGGLRVRYVLGRIIERFPNDFEKEEAKPVIVKAPKDDQSHMVHIQGNNDFAVKFAKCCMPVPGDPIIGYITRGRGVSVHRSDCVNMLHSTEKDRFISVDWINKSQSQSTKNKFASELMIRAVDRNKLLSDVATLISNEGVSISGISSRIMKDSTVNMNIDVVISDTEQLERLMAKIELIENIISVYRI
ncbi:MAG: bifunctional (p)ppGpp synthetase/guanosine-3',5'-bis(diphosphate) 3'-pyrophosphohydrolase [Anaerofustis stercorihominis]|nr:bifunctional (p)ppGpp synthetase/guanosine-3',5'-bis(diphosphate) 3'-pyrophosphohydrolase [Anaerofustis stercorihominis]